MTQGKIFRIFVFLLFIITVIAGKAMHEMWRDETVVWLQATTSWEVFFTVFADAGHPPLGGRPGQR